MKKIVGYRALVIALGLISLSPLAQANDLVFMADESDLSAFDKMLDKQRSEKLPKDSGPSGSLKAKENFGQIVREEAKQITREENKEKSMGAFVREQRRKDSLNRGRGAGASSGSSARGQGSDLRGIVSEKKGGGKSQARGRRDR